VPAGSFTIEHVVKTDWAVDLGVDIVLASDNVFERGELLGLFFCIDFGPFAGASVQCIGWLSIVNLSSTRVSGVFGFGLFSSFHGTRDIFPCKNTLTTPTTILQRYNNPLLTTRQDNNQYHNSQKSSKHSPYNQPNQVISTGFAGIDIYTRVPSIYGELRIIRLIATGMSALGFTEILCFPLWTLGDFAGGVFFILCLGLVLLAYRMAAWGHCKSHCGWGAGGCCALFITYWTTEITQSWALFLALCLWGLLIVGVIIGTVLCIVGG
jgi:hypothetical protein